MFEPGQFLAFDYPAANYEHVKLRWERRRVKVLACRDTFELPLLAETINSDPMKLRGRYLYTCLDLDCGAERMFWDCSMRNVEDFELDPSSILMEQSEHTACGVLAIEPDIRVRPHEPDRFRVRAVIADGISPTFAESIADALNTDTIASCGFRGRLAIPIGYGTVS
jgi:hypothetical protein